MSRIVRTATLLVVPTKEEIALCLTNELQNRSIEHVALSGGSLPSLLQMKPEWQWHIYLADERCVPSTRPDSNLGALFAANCLQHIPPDHIHGINEELLEDPHACAQDYQQLLQQHLFLQQRGLDLAVLGFGEDGHTCSLFPHHSLLHSPNHVAAILDSPKPPPHRITLTLKALAETQHVIFVGAGSAKAPVLRQVFEQQVQWEETDSESISVRRATVQMRDPAPFPCGAVTAQQSVTWIVDAEAAAQL
ncbi:6-phosphogluconolactonase [Fistulifera solaris]|uniref:6-phosphogluconolactonase n=1 Tax=Fistulifera solaris TaxID=1519565 RepID=A0A1Z5KCM5_FISSO|nr:6-phosphogluconolactonase [Fistulifera solaris]|eukprot:GAX24054.1 6-phosphogluconolactonase [Fistulifera solaris]